MFTGLRQPFTSVPARPRPSWDQPSPNPQGERQLLVPSALHNGCCGPGLHITASAPLAPGGRQVQAPLGSRLSLSVWQDNLSTALPSLSLTRSSLLLTVCSTANTQPHAPCPCQGLTSPCSCVCPPGRKGTHGKELLLRRRPRAGTLPSSLHRHPTGRRRQREQLQPHVKAGPQ